MLLSTNAVGRHPARAHHTRSTPGSIGHVSGTLVCLPLFAGRPPGRLEPLHRRCLFICLFVLHRCQCARGRPWPHSQHPHAAPLLEGGPDRPFLQERAVRPKDRSPAGGGEIRDCHQWLGDCRAPHRELELVPTEEVELHPNQTPVVKLSSVGGYKVAAPQRQLSGL